MNDSQRVHVGGYEAWMENGKLTLFYHKFGSASGSCVKMNPDETMGLLELLFQNKDAIYNAAGGEDWNRHRHQIQESLSH